MPGAQIFLLSGKPEKTGILLDAVIRNNGKPSVAVDWKLEVVLPDGSSVPAYSSVIPQKLSILRERIAPPTPLAEMTLTQAVDSVPRQGQLLFYTDAALERVTNSNTVFVLSVEDNAGTRYTKRQRSGDWLHL